MCSQRRTQLEDNSTEHNISPLRSLLIYLLVKIIEELTSVAPFWSLAVEAIPPPTAWTTKAITSKEQNKMVSIPISNDDELRSLKENKI